MRNELALASLRNDLLELILLPTEQCNFRCTYCYETFEHRKMAPAVVAGVKSLITRRRSSLSHLHLSWFGGEPLVARDVMFDISDHALRTAGAAGFDFTASITTNGYFLDAETFASCIAARIGRYQISLDGDRATHDRSRKLGSGAGTFERIWANLLGMKSTSADFSVLLRLHYTIDNYEEIATFAGKVREAFGDDPRFEVYFKKIGRLGGPNDEAIKKIGARKQSEIEAYLWSAYGARPELSARETMERDYICYAARANSLMVRSTGRLGKCTVALHDDFNTIGELKPDGEIVVDQDKFQRWITPVLEQRWEHVGCPLDFVAKDALRKMAGAPAETAAAGQAAASTASCSSGALAGSTT